MAKTFGQPLHVVCAYNLRPAMGTGLGLSGELAVSVEPQAWVESVLTDVAAQVRQEGVTVITHTKVGNAAEAILDVADEVHADLIVVGNRGIDSKSRFILGNVPSRVVHHATCSTYVVHTTDTHR